MSHRALIIGAGMGGLTAAIRLARRGVLVEVLEARTDAGGLASRFEVKGFRFDAGPYILLDRPGLEWALASLGIDLAETLILRRIEDVYRVQSVGKTLISFYSSLERTADELEKQWPGSGSKYKQFVTAMATTHRRLSPMLYVSRPGILDLIGAQALSYAPFLLRSLGDVLSQSELPIEVTKAIGIWTQIAGQNIGTAPSPMAFVPALIHTVGAFTPVGGIGTIPELLAAVAQEAGVVFRFGTKVQTIVTSSRKVDGVRTTDGEFIAADSIVSNHHAVGTYVDLLSKEAIPFKKFQGLPLQSPGACVYLACRGNPKSPYLKFFLQEDKLCRLFVSPGVVEPEVERDGWFPARLIAPMNYEMARHLSADEQKKFVEELLAESWWQEDVDEFRVLSSRAPTEWGSQFNLYHDSMNPVMTSRFMRAGRIAHRSPYVRGLYLAGSSTHPGQWVSFCAISGILAADQLLRDLR